MTKYIIYKEGSKIKGSTKENYHAMIQDAHKIRTFGDFTSLQQAKNYLITWTSLKDEEIEIIGKEEEK